MILRIFISFLIFLFCIPLIVISAPVVALRLMDTTWDGKSTIFGNAKHGWGPKPGYWSEFNWLVIRNHINNFLTRNLAFNGIANKTSIVKGNLNIGDKIAGGFYSVRFGKVWEYYWIRPYNFFGKRCIRARIGWKLVNADKPAAFVFSINLWKEYLGV